MTPSEHPSLPGRRDFIRRSGYRGYVPIETLAMGRKDYDPYAEAARMLAEFREAVAATA